VKAPKNCFDAKHVVYI